MSAQHMLQLLTITSLLTLSACTASTPGQEEQLEFSYTSNSPSFDRLLAVGAKLDLSVSDLERSDVVIERVQSDDEEVLKASIGPDNKVIVEATGEGRAKLTIRASTNNFERSLTDTVEIVTRVPQVVKVSHSCEGMSEDISLDEGYYLKGQTIELPYKVQLKDGQNLIGYGYNPIEFDNTTTKLASVDFVSAKLKVELGDVAGKVKLTSPFDPSLLQILNIVEAAQIDGAHLELQEPVSTAESSFAIVRPALAGIPLCKTSLTFTLTTLTPEICEVNTFNDLLALESPDEDIILDGEFGWIDIKGKVVGDCKFTVNYPQGAEGAGVSAELSVAVTAP